MPFGSAKGGAIEIGREVGPLPSGLMTNKAGGAEELFACGQITRGFCDGAEFCKFFIKLPSFSGGEQGGRFKGALYARFAMHLFRLNHLCIGIRNAGATGGKV